MSSSEVSLQISFHRSEEAQLSVSPPPPTPPSLNEPFPLSDSYLLLVNLFFLFVFSQMRKKRSTTVQKLQETLNERPYSLLLMIGKSLSSFLLINTEYWWSFGTCNTACLVYQSENVNLTITCQPHTLTATSTNTDCTWFHIYIHKPLGCYSLVYKQSGANSR